MAYVVQVSDYMWKMSLRLEEIGIQMETERGRLDLIDKIMNIHDANGDGFLNAEEFYSPLRRTENRRTEL